VHILITGAAGAIGSALARGFRSRHPEAAFTLVDVDAAGLATVAGAVGHADAAVWDLSQPDTLPAAVAGVVDRRGPVSVLVNCAGIMEMRTLVGTPWSLGQRLLDIDLVSPLRLMNLVAPGMMERRAGAIVNVSSMAGVTPLRGCTYYGGAKAGLAMASEVLRLELAPHGVQVITVYPGPVRSALEQRARKQVPPDLLSRILPTGDPEVLARRVLRAYEKREAQVVYPPLYDFGNRIPRIAGWITTHFSPAPRA
jgi:short-subunit dehydrogenase